MTTLVSRSLLRLRPFVTLGVVLTIVLGATVQPVSTAPGDVVVMNDRDALMGSPLVVWGNTRHPNGTPYTIDFGDASPDEVGVVSDRSYIATNHTYSSGGVFT